MPPPPLLLPRAIAAATTTAAPLQHPETVPIICLFSCLGYVTVCLILLLIKHFGATSAEIVKSMRKVAQVALSFAVFPKPFDWKYLVGGALVAGALYWLQAAKKLPPPPPPPLASAGTASGAASGAGGQLEPRWQSPVKGAASRVSTSGGAAAPAGGGAVVALAATAVGSLGLSRGFDLSSRDGDKDG